MSKNVLFSLKNNPVVFMNGARQSGKSTLAQLFAKDGLFSEYVSFDNITQLSAASASPESFLQRKGPIIIDEVQMVPELFRALKVVVDELRYSDKKNCNGRFLLTGSANIMALPKLADSLVGRMGVKTLYPFSGCEVYGGSGDFIKNLLQLSSLK